MNTSEDSYAIAASFNDGFALAAAVALRSVSMHWTKSEPVDVYIFDGGVTAVSRSRVEQSIDSERMRLHWCRVDEGQFQDLPRRMKGTLQSVYRFAIADMLPPTIQRVVWIDLDVLVYRCLSELWEVDLDGKPIAAVQDMAIPYISSPLGLQPFKKGDPTSKLPYFNSGLVVIDMNRWRTDESAHQLIQLLKDQPWGIGHQDQHAMNVLYLNNWVALDLRWNVLSSLAGRSFYKAPPPALPRERDVASAPWLVHYAGYFKPWKIKGRLPFFDDFKTMLEQCPFPPIRYKRFAGLPALYDQYLRHWLYPLERLCWIMRHRLTGN